MVTRMVLRLLLDLALLDFRIFDIQLFEELWGEY